MATQQMPRRPDQHVVGDQAVVAFQDVFLGWVVREGGRSDYGVDAEVEVFQNNFATGLTFKAQIKGSRKKLRGRNPSVQIKTSTLNYWLSLDVPVLVCYFSVESGATYARWAHSHHPAVGRARRRGADPRTTTFTFNVEHRVDTGIKEKLYAELITNKLLKERSRLAAIPIKIIVRDDSRTSLAEYESRFRNLFEQNGIFRISADTEVAGILEFDRKKFRFAMPVDLSSLTVHHETTQSLVDVDFEKFSADVMVATASVLATMGFTRQAVEVARAFHIQSSISLSTEIAGRLSIGFLEQGEIDEALGIIAPLVAMAPDRSERVAADQLLWPIYHFHLGKLSEAGVNVLLMTLDRRIELECSEENLTEGANIAYTKANVLKARMRWNEAIDTFYRAAELDTAYYNRAYFHREVGGCFADLGRWFEAADCYERSRHSEGRARDIDFVYVDALMQSGRYSEASEVAAAAGADDQHSIGKTALLEIILANIIKSIGIDQQYRHQLTERGLQLLGDSILPEQLVTALASTDALDTNLWEKYLLTNSDENEDGPKKAFAAILTMARIELNNPLYWEAYAEPLENMIDNWRPRS